MNMNTAFIHLSPYICTSNKYPIIVEEKNKKDSIKKYRCNSIKVYTDKNNDNKITFLFYKKIKNNYKIILNKIVLDEAKINLNNDFRIINIKFYTGYSYINIYIPEDPLLKDMFNKFYNNVFNLFTNLI